jgi:hypothetical protein
MNRKKEDLTPSSTENYTNSIRSGPKVKNNFFVVNESASKQMIDIDEPFKAALMAA